MTSPSSKKPLRAAQWLAYGMLLAVAGAGAYWLYEQPKPVVDAAAPATASRRGAARTEAVPVALADIVKGDIDIIDRALGTVTPLASVTVRTQINGLLQEVAFQEGQLVQKGDFLAQIDPRPYQMTLEQAMGALQKDQALLKEAQTTLARFEKLLAQDSIAKQQVDSQASLVQQYQGSVTSDQGQIDAAKLNISYCHIVAPISGRVGLRQVDAGNYAQISDANGLVTLTQTDPISVLFTLPEDQLPPVAKQVATGAVLAVAAYDRGDKIKLAEGKLVAVDNQISTSTGTVKLRAQFDNGDGQLFPNQFVNIRIKVDTVHDAALAPQAAVLRGVPGTFVYVAKEDGSVAMRPVKLGVATGDQVEILEGVTVGDKVVVDGTEKLRDGGKYQLPEAAAGRKN